MNSQVVSAARTVGIVAGAAVVISILGIAATDPDNRLIQAIFAVSLITALVSALIVTIAQVSRDGIPENKKLRDWERAHPALVPLILVVCVIAIVLLRYAR